jgi:hypothetical protein
MHGDSKVHEALVSGRCFALRNSFGLQMYEYEGWKGFDRYIDR